MFHFFLVHFFLSIVTSPFFHVDKSVVIVVRIGIQAFNLVSSRIQAIICATTAIARYRSWVLWLYLFFGCREGLEGRVGPER